jgi:epoxyqueuosine reductase QueG
MEPLIKQDLTEYIKEHGAYDVRVADPHRGFEHAIPGRHPLEILPTCRSVVVFVMPCPAWINNTVLGLYAKEEITSGRSKHGALTSAAWSTHHSLRVMKGAIYGHIWYAAAYYLNQRGYQVADFLNRAARPQDKLCAYEAGLGVYGRSGILLHPELGNRIAPGVLLTDAVLEPDGKLEGFAPCATCGACIKACPGHAIDPDKPYPESWTKENCHTFRYSIRKDDIYCHECLRVCPAAKVRDADMAFMRRCYSYGEKKRRDREQGTNTAVMQDITPV